MNSCYYHLRQDLFCWCISWKYTVKANNVIKLVYSFVSKTYLRSIDCVSLRHLFSLILITCSCFVCLLKQEDFHLYLCFSWLFKLLLSNVLKAPLKQDSYIKGAYSWHSFFIQHMERDRLWINCCKMHFQRCHKNIINDSNIQS